MPQVSHHFVVDRPIDAVFDVVSTARFWTEWHPATRSVEGDVDHPARLGDRIIEHVTIAGIEGTGTWTVVEHVWPHHLALETDLAVGHLRISYQLTTVDGGGTRFRRDLDFPELGPHVGAAMQTQSAEGITSLARLVLNQARETQAGGPDVTMATVTTAPPEPTRGGGVT
ncbi:MAG TPA: SRPBCC family protein [Streptosporangiaceae bacterium]|nr:SRPBCC family protein [Streptosporangiaceae bacterium]